MNKLSIIIPVLNEEKTVETVLKKINELVIPEWERQIIVVDDGSQDSSKARVQNAKFQFKIQNLIILAHDTSQGKGAAIKTALGSVTGNYVIIQDADLEYDPQEIPALIKEISDANCSVVYGSRNLHPDRRGYLHYVLGAAFLTWFVNALCHSRLTDAYTGYKLIPTALLRSINLVSRGFEFEAEVTVKILKKGIKIKEIPIRYYPRKFSEGKKIKFTDGFRGLASIIKFYFVSLLAHMREK